MQKMLWILVALVFWSCATTQPSRASDLDEAAIRAARGRLDEALARRQLAAMNDELVENVSITGPVWRTVGRDQLLQAYTRLLSARPDLVWIREPQTVRINASWLFASESGEWREQWREGGALTELRGSYLALWRKVEGHWRLDAEVFVPLSCEGSSYCDP
jgi:Domain of unknown function (DUF4440)